MNEARQRLEWRFSLDCSKGSGVKCFGDSMTFDSNNFGVVLGKEEYVDDGGRFHVL